MHPTRLSNPLSPIAVALDTDSRQQFRNWCAAFGPRVGVLKVGLEAFIRWGASAVEEAVQAGPAGLFLDLKLHDIPNTVRGAVRSARAMGVQYLTVHASGGQPMLEAAVEASEGEIHILAVTVLTHLQQEDLEVLSMPGQVAERALRWAQLAHSAGCAGVVCSPRELTLLRPQLPSPFLLVTPGIRPAGAPQGDQRRVATPAEALSAGADLLVIGRPLTRADNPDQALDLLASELEGL